MRVSLRQEMVAIDGDPVRLAQVFANLLNNAVKYTDPGGRVAIDAETGEGRVVVTVSDTGMGIAPEMLAHVFDLFAQVEHSRARAQGGLGIGLALVRKLVQLHGGEIEARSAGAGQGSRFIVRLPVASEAPADAGTA